MTDTEIEATPAPATLTINTQGQSVTFTPLSDAELQEVIGLCTPSQRQTRPHIASGVHPAEAARRAGVKPKTTDAWRSRSPAFRDAWYTLYSGSKALSTDAIRAAASHDALLHYETLHTLTERESRLRLMARLCCPLSRSL